MLLSKLLAIVLDVVDAVDMVGKLRGFTLLSSRVRVVVRCDELVE